MHSEVRNHILYLSQAVTVNTVTDEAHEAFMRCLREDVHTVDLSAVDEADSACVALLIAALREKKQQHVHFVGIPSGLAQLMTLYEVDKWIKP